MHDGFRLGRPSDWILPPGCAMSLNIAINPQSESRISWPGKSIAAAHPAILARCGLMFSAISILVLAEVASAQTVSLDNVPPIALTTSISVPALSLSPATGNVTVRSAAGTYSQCLATGAAGVADKSGLAGNTQLQFNANVIPLASSVPVTYLNRTVANGRRVLNMRVAQPLLCADFATTPGVGVNPVAWQFVDPNFDSSGLLFGGISQMDYFTNGAANSRLRINADSRLACCIMLPAANASCFQGPNGAAPEQKSAANVAVAARTARGQSGDLQVSVSGPSTVAPGAAFNYTIGVSNIGATAVSGARVRDWYPKSNGGFPAVLGNGSWNCTATAGANCGTSAGTGNLALNAVSLNPGASVTVSVSRPLGASTPIGTQFSVSAAAFAPPVDAEAILSNNQSALSATAGGAPLITAFSASSTNVFPSSTITLNWNSSNTTSCSPSQGSGTVWSVLGTLAPSGSQSFTAPGGPGTLIFQLNCTNGSTSTSATVQVNVIPAAPAPVISAFFPSSPTVVAGSTIILNWATSNATSCSPALGGSTSWSGAGTLSTNGTRNLNAPSTATSITFQLTCLSNGQATTATTIVTVTAPSTPVIHWFYPSLATVIVGAPITLNWSSNNASACTATQGPGTAWTTPPSPAVVGLRTFNAPATVGSITFQLNCSNGGAPVSATTQVNVIANTTPTANLMIPVTSIASCDPLLTASTSTPISWSSTNAAYCVASEVLPVRTNWTLISCLGDGGCPETTDRRKLRPNQSGDQLIIRNNNAGSVATLRLTCYNSVSGASATSERQLTLVTGTPNECPLNMSYVPSPTTTGPAPLPDGSYQVQASISNPQGLPLSASVLQQGQYGDVTVEIVGDTVNVRYYPRVGDFPEAGVVNESIQVLIGNGGNGVPVTYIFQLDPVLFSSGFE